MDGGITGSSISELFDVLLVLSSIGDGYDFVGYISSGVRCRCMGVWMGVRVLGAGLEFRFWLVLGV